MHRCLACATPIPICYPSKFGLTYRRNNEIARSPKNIGSYPPLYPVYQCTITDRINIFRVHGHRLNIYLRSVTVRSYLHFVSDPSLHGHSCSHHQDQDRSVAGSVTLQVPGSCFTWQIHASL